MLLLCNSCNNLLQVRPRQDTLSMRAAWGKNIFLLFFEFFYGPPKPFLQFFDFSCLVFLLTSLSRFHHFFNFLHQPHLRKHSSLFYCIFVSPFLISVSYLETNFPEIPFQTEFVLILVVGFFCCCFCLIICVYFYLLFWLCLLFCFQILKNIVSCNFSFFLVCCLFKSCLFVRRMFWLLFFVVFVGFKMKLACYIYIYGNVCLI